MNEQEHDPRGETPKVSCIKNRTFPQFLSLFGSCFHSSVLFFDVVGATMADIERDGGTLSKSLV